LSQFGGLGCLDAGQISLDPRGPEPMALFEQGERSDQALVAPAPMVLLVNTERIGDDPHFGAWNGFLVRESGVFPQQQCRAGGGESEERLTAVHLHKSKHAGGDPAIDQEHAAGDVTSGIAGQQESGGGQFGRLAPAIHGGALGKGLFLLFAEDSHRHFGGERAGGQAIDGDAMRP